MDTCDVTVDGTSVAIGDPLPTGTPGLKTVRVVSRDLAGNEAVLERGYRVLAGERSEPIVQGGDRLMTDPGGLGAGVRVPVQTEVLIGRSVGGIFEVSRVASPPAPPSGLTDLPGAAALRVLFPGRIQVLIQPSHVWFRIDSSILPANPDRVTLARDGVVVPACVNGPGFLPDPDPCVSSRQTLPDGDLRIEAYMILADDPVTDGDGNVVAERFDAVWSFALPAPDVTAPVIALVSPAENTLLPRDGLLELDVSCADEFGGSGLASCAATVDGSPVADGGALPATPGTHRVHVATRDVAGNEAALDRDYVVPAASISVTEVFGPATVSTGTVATPAEPIQTEVAVPQAASGSVSVLPVTAGTPPAGYALVPGAPDLLIHSPDGSAAAPLRLTFTLDASLLAGPPVIPAASIVPTRDGVPVADCTAPVPSVPDPCVESRATDGQGDVRVVVRTSHASTWALVRRLAPPAGASIADAAIVEADTGTDALRFTLTRTGSLAQAATLRWDTVDGTARAGLDYTAQVGKSVRSPRARRARPSPCRWPATGSTSRTRRSAVRLSSPSGTAIMDGEAIGTIVDDDPPGLSVEDATRIEGNSGTRDLNFTVRLSKKWNRAVSAAWSIQDITTTAGSDYDTGRGAISGRVTIASGARTATVTVRVKGDRAREGVAEQPGGPRYERLRIVLSGPADAAITDGDAVGRIQDDD